MAYLLAISVLLNAALGTAVVRLLRRRRGRPLPRRRPDFPSVESALREAAARPGVAAALRVESFEARQWLCRAEVRHLGGSSHDAFEAVVALVSDVSRRCQLPGRVAGTFGDPGDRPRMVGNIIEFGYSSEVGYRHRNEFAEPQPAS